MKKLLNYSEAFLFILIFGIGNVVNLIWKKHMTKVIWIIIAGLWLQNFYQWYQDPSGTWEITKTNFQNPWYWIPLSTLPILFIFVGFVITKNRKQTKQTLKILEGMRESLKKSAEETMLLKSNEIPSDEDIDKYYRMYCKKFELDNRDQWNTAEPMTFEFWEKCAKNDFEVEQFGRVKWQFMIAKTSDMFSFDPSTGQSTMMRFHDYEEMIDENEFENEFTKDLINRQLDIE
jgi:hypothetical protein